MKKPKPKVKKPTTKNSNRVVAVVCSDVHLSDKPPTARLEQTEDHWFEAMKWVLTELIEVANLHQCPLVIAGDLFDQPKPSVKLVRLAYDELSCLKYSCFAVAGQHDLPNHSMEYFDESGMGLLRKVGALKMLANAPVDIGGVHVYGASWGDWYPTTIDKSKVNVLIAHMYCWKEQHSYPGAPENKHAQYHLSFMDELGYRSAVFGDNHLGFEHVEMGTVSGRLVNNGIVIPRNSDFTKYTACYTLLYADGTVQAVPLSEQAKWQPWVENGESTKKASKQVLDFAKNIASLVGKDTKENFLDELTAELNRLDDETVRQKVWDIVTKAQGSLK